MTHQRFALIACSLLTGAALTACGSSQKSTGPTNNPGQPTVNAKVDLSLLDDREKWNKASPADQDAVIQAVGQSLGSAYSFVETKQYSAGGQSHRIATFKHNRSGALLNLIPGGTYDMGDDSSATSQPIHKVTIKPMLIGRTELPQSAWDAIGGRDQRCPRGRGPTAPINGVTYYDIQAWCKKAGDGLRMPSESEWEYAARAGNQLDYFWSTNPKRDKMIGSYCVHRKKSQSAFTVAMSGAPQEVTKNATRTNAFGLSDVLGNVSEICADNFLAGYQNGPNDHNPRYQQRNYQVVTRGGGFTMTADLCTTGKRSAIGIQKGSFDQGFRVARSLK